MDTFQIGDVTGYKALPAGGKGPGLIVLHAWWGLNAVIKEFCDRLAAEGFVVFAPDLYHGAVATTIEEAQKLASSFDQNPPYSDIIAVVEHLQADPAVSSPSLGVIGFSLGVFLTLWLAQNRAKDIAAAVLFYGTGYEDFDQAQAKFQGHFAENDPYEPKESVENLEKLLRQAGREVEFHTYPGTGHWFFEQDRPDAYNADAAHIAWERTLAFLKRSSSK
jgi:carboxymethylenebutenolidase